MSLWVTMPRMGMVVLRGSLRRRLGGTARRQRWRRKGRSVPRGLRSLGRKRPSSVAEAALDDQCDRWLAGASFYCAAHLVDKNLTEGSGVRFPRRGAPCELGVCAPGSLSMSRLPTAGTFARRRADCNSPQKHVWRAQIVLMTEDGHGTAEITCVVGVCRLVLAGVVHAMRCDGLLRIIPAARTVDLTVSWCGSTGCDSQSSPDGGCGDGGRDYAIGCFGG